MNDNYCSNCDKKTDVAYEVPSGDYVCLDCWSGLIDKAEMAYESQREDGLI